jgi:S-adenosylmethionine hydrolase
MRRPIITLTTDFGLSDHFGGVMKGVILGICPAAEIVDISHEVGAFGVTEGAFLLAQAYRYFPRGTVHVAVIDPGVGTSRRPILVEAAGQRFVAPDNGVLTMIYAREEHKVRWVAAQKYFLKPVSQTFHGRDIFSPVAAHLASGVSPAKMGKVIADYMRLHFENPVRTARRGWTVRDVGGDAHGRQAGAKLRRVRAGRVVPHRGQLGISGGLVQPGFGREDTGVWRGRAGGIKNTLEKVEAAC